MPLTPYFRVLRESRLGITMLLGLMVRTPVAACGVILTLHVVAMGRSYAEAGVAMMILTVGLALSGPWRGRRLDRVGLRRTVWPSLVVLTFCWSAAPYLGYVPLLALCLLAGVFTIPSFSIIRQAVIAAVPRRDRRTALAMDSVAVEISFMVGPLVGVWAATIWDTGWVLGGVGLAGVGAGALLWWMDPPLRGALSDSDVQGGGFKAWFTPTVAVICMVGVATTITLSGTDIAVVAAMRGWDRTAQVGWVLALWCLGSLVGGLAYGLLSRPVPSLWLLLALGAVTFPVAWARDVVTLTVLVAVAGLLCAPTTTAMVDELSQVVPERFRGEAMGWHASFLQVGSALGAPLAGAAIDGGGFGAGFMAVAMTSMAIAVLGLALAWVRRRTCAVTSVRPG
ncbi:Predicted arabinose efflux permease, MFS family [Austwickia chelonae]|uniref:Putative major facilitator superfamily transporter n=1 Tax=Austwickia chelonae NBRC 105200 TaxID=1184607 RepID=K6VM45_9MICO|nr:MFS transporter [Austwickia chelonae]GAB76455.1 putative major facilitator superfamily transporter [Austwickia chelonae NBRC 105200]SEW24999.1 Predicted arabinose efflux permease, MFS family [Austwickia chelonae]